MMRILILACGTALAMAQAPCPFVDVDVARFGFQPYRNSPVISSKDGSLDTTLVVKYTDEKSTSIGGCQVKLRSYNGQLVGPTLRAKPGDVMHILLQNQLPLETPNEVEQQYQQELTNAVISTRPVSFNTTNLHVHGLHVSPAGNSDNVLLAIPPQNSFAYEIRIPRNHPRGTFWYHAHAHGSTAIQVGSGMAGALIIEDDETKIPGALREASRNEKVMVIQTTLYNTSGKLDNITTTFPNGPGTWPDSKRRATINGQLVPRFKMRPGEVQRWRVVDASFRESISLLLEQHALHEIGTDGNYLGKVDSWPSGTPIVLQPGYRTDVLVQASRTPGIYRLMDGASSAGASLLQVAEPQNVLAEMVVEGQPMTMRLPASAEMAPLAPFPGVDLSKKAVGVQQVVFKVGNEIERDPNKKPRHYFHINYQAFQPQHVRQLTLNAVEQWSVSTVGDPPGVPHGLPPNPHVFHIHVNPFQMTRAGPDGQPEVIWKDTLLVNPGETVTLFTTYLDYIGKFVMHCHILDHEDLGMMEVLEVVDPASGVKSGHQH